MGMLTFLENNEAKKAEAEKTKEAEAKVVEKPKKETKSK